MLAAVRAVCANFPQPATWICDGARNNPANGVRCSPHGVHNMIMAPGAESGLVGGDETVMAVIRKLDALAARRGSGLPRRSDVRWAGAFFLVKAAVAKRESLGAALTEAEWRIVDDLYHLLGAFLAASRHLERDNATVLDVEPTMLELERKLRGYTCTSAYMQHWLPTFMSRSFVPRMQRMISPHHRLAAALSMGNTKAQRVAALTPEVVACAVALAKTLTTRPDGAAPAAPAAPLDDEAMSLDDVTAYVSAGDVGGGSEAAVEAKLRAELDAFRRRMPLVYAKGGAPLTHKEVLVGWDKFRADYPLLSAVAIAARTTPASSAPLERAFSAVSYLLSSPTRRRATA